MSGKAPTLTLLIPELLRPPTPQAAHLRRLLGPARSHDLPVNGYEPSLLHLAGCREAGREGLAAVAARGEGLAEEAGRYWMRVDPVYLRADQDRLHLFAPALLAIEAAEAVHLIESLNACYAGDGLRFCAPHPDRWYVSLPAPADIQTRPLSTVAGDDLRAALPQGTEAGHWQRFMTEVQMLFNQHPVNQARRAEGRPEINAVWCWGTPVPDQTQASARPTEVWADDGLAQALARECGRAVHPLPGDAEAWLDRAEAGTDHLLVITALQAAWLRGDAEARQAGASHFLAHWLEPLTHYLRRRRLSRLILVPADGRAWVLTPTSHWRFWRRGGDRVKGEQA